MAELTALVLAGRRGSEDATGVRHKALLEVAGVPMLLRVVRCLRASPVIGRVIVSIDEPKVLEAAPELAALIAAGELALHTSLSSPSRSVHDVLEREDGGGTLLVTTADHALLTPEIVEHFAAGAEASEADMAVGTVAISRVLARYPEAVRTVLKLRGEGWCGANLFAFRTARGRRAAEFWVRAESFRKRPWRLVSAFGPVTLLLFLLRRLDLESALTRVSRAMGAHVRAIPLPFPEAAIDVDNPRDFALASRILADRS